MISFFFYNKLTNPEIISKINDNYEISDGFINVQQSNIDANFIEISNDPANNTIQLNGKIVKFDMKIGFIVKKIHEIEAIQSANKTKYTIQTITATNTLGGTCDTYIIY
jgi:hypothetical protein